MRIEITSDHAVHDLRIDPVPRLRKPGYDVVNHGPVISERTDYAKWEVQLVREVAAVRSNAGIVICGSGVGISIAANRVRGIRVACVSEAHSATMSRRHNNANIPCFGSQVVGPDVALAICEAFLGAFPEGGHHAGRVTQLQQLDAGDVSFLDEGC